MHMHDACGTCPECSPPPSTCAAPVQIKRQACNSLPKAIVSQHDRVAPVLQQAPQPAPQTSLQTRMGGPHKGSVTPSGSLAMGSSTEQYQQPTPAPRRSLLQHVVQLANTDGRIIAVANDDCLHHDVAITKQPHLAC